MPTPSLVTALAGNKAALLAPAAKLGTAAADAAGRATGSGSCNPHWAVLWTGLAQGQGLRLKLGLKLGLGLLVSSNTRFPLAP